MFYFWGAGKKIETQKNLKWDVEKKKLNVKKPKMGRETFKYRTWKKKVGSENCFTSRFRPWKKVQPAQPVQPVQPRERGGGL